MTQEIEWTVNYEWVNLSNFQTIDGAWVRFNCKNLIYKNNPYEVQMKFTYTGSNYTNKYPIDRENAYEVGSLTLVTPFVDEFYKFHITKIALDQFHKKFNKNEILEGLTKAAIESTEKEIEKHAKHVEKFLELKEKLYKLKG